jgi:UDPglucose 6-dehydrogenase
MARIATVGLWHLGSVVSAALADLGHTVTGMDPDSETVRQLQQGIPAVREPGLPELIAEQAKLGRLTFVLTAREAFAAAEFIFLTFDTPVDEQDRGDLSPVEACLKQIAQHASSRATIVVMSQVPVGTCDRFAEELHRLAPHASFSVVCQPENLRLGEALSVFFQPDFLMVGVAVGAEGESAAARVLDLYGDMQVQKLVVRRNSAEMAKHALNAFLATSISFVNELAVLAEVSETDIREVVRVLRLDRRIGKYAALNPGAGFSGGTLGRDLQTLRRLGARNNRKTLQLDATVAVNDSRLQCLIATLRGECAALPGLHIALLGLTYKSGTSTLRRSRSLELANMLLVSGASIRAFDPMVLEARPETHGIVLSPDAYQAAEGADAILLMTPWPEFQKLDLARLRKVMHLPVLVDAHNWLDVERARAAGFRYFGVGIPKNAHSSVRVSAPVGAATGAGQ